jgi:hypothetical protein
VEAGQVLAQLAQVSRQAHRRGRAALEPLVDDPQRLRRADA